MTINSEVRAAGPFAGNGVTTSFPFEFKVFAGSEVLVVRELEGVELVLALGTDYTVALNADQDSAPGGSVDLPAPLPVGYTLSLTSDLAPLQPVDLTTQGGFYPRVINASLDRLTILVQQLSERLGRTLVSPISDGGSGFGDLPGKDARKGAVLAFDEVTGAPLVGPSIASVGTVSANVVSVNTVAAQIAAVLIAAANVTDITNFADVYYGPSAADPTTRRDGSPLQEGDLYFNTAEDVMRVYDGTQWTAMVSGGIGLSTSSGDVRYTQRSNNLSDVADVATARSNLGAAPLASPAFTGNPTAPTAAAGTNTTQIATTAFVTAAANLKANIASPAFTGTPTAPTPSAGTRSTAIATMQSFADEFGSSLAANGYQKLPSGLIIQWGSFSSGVTSYSFPIAFPTAFRSISCMQAGTTSSSSARIALLNTPTTSGFTTASIASNMLPAYWTAIGH